MRQCAVTKQQARKLQFIHYVVHIFLYSCGGGGGVGVLSKKDLMAGDVPPIDWVAKSTSRYINDHLILCKIWHVNGSIFQNFPKF